jgi:uncharacterized protein YecT (DUF1311 family)
MCLLAVLAAFPISMAHAAGCADAQDQATLNVCAAKAYKASDGELNKLFKQIRQRLKDDADKTKLLVDAQKAWIGFRDAECAFSSSGVSGGSAYPMVHAMCLDSLTRKRIADFKADLNCQEGDLSCAVPAN